jgi:hypothetical protein
MRVKLAAVLTLLALNAEPAKLRAQTFSSASAAPTFTSPTELQYNGAAYTSSSFTITANCNNAGDCFVRLFPPASSTTPFPVAWRLAAFNGSNQTACTATITSSYAAITAGGALVATIKKNQSCTMTFQFQTTLDPSTSWATLKVSGTPYLQQVAIRISNS